VEKAIAFGGRIADAANDHHEEVFRGHYAQGTTLRVMSGRVITTAQDHWFAKALEGPTVLTGSTEVLDAPDQVAALGLTRQQADDIRHGALDMGLTQCSDPHNSPYGQSHVNLQAVLTERTDDEKALARKHIEAGEPAAPRSARRVPSSLRHTLRP